MSLDERSLRAFLAVADSGSLGRAAGAMNTTQPTLTRLIQGMEQRFGQPLFERQSKGMTLTQAGEVLVAQARSLVFEMEQAAQTLADLKQSRRGVLRVGGVAAIARGMLAAALAEVLAKAPGLRAELIEAPDDDLVEALLGHRVDVIFTSTLAPHPDIAPLGPCAFADCFSVVAASDHPRIGPGPMTLDRVLAERWVMPGPTASPRLQFETLVAAHRPEPADIALTSDSVGAQIAVIAQSSLLGWLPVPLLAEALASGAVQRVDVPELAHVRHFSAYRRRRGHVGDAVRRLMDNLPTT